MLSREQGWRFDQHMHGIWSRDAMLGFYTNTISGDQQCEPPPDCRGGILADDMGLGKTLSIIALIASDKDNAPVTKSIPKYSGVAATLLVARAPLLAVWLRQLTQHLRPGALNWRVHHSSQRIRNAEELSNVDVVLTTYQTLVAEWMKNQASQQQAFFAAMWHRVVLDEAHDVRDTRSKTAQAVYALQAARRWAVTGTPIQNRIDDLAGLYRFLRVYPYDEPPLFRNQIKLLCDMSNKNEAGDRLKRLIQSIMLRRSITHVTLPERKDLICRLDFSSEERALYDSAKNDTLGCISATVEDQESGINALQALNRLRLLCNHGTLYHGRHPKYQPIQRDAPEWQQSDAQDAYNAMVMAGSALCFACKADIGSGSAEVADQVVGTAVRPILSRCMQLYCCSCQEQPGGERLSCGHQPSHGFHHVCTLSSDMPTSSPQNSPVEKMPTKIQALLRDVQEHALHEKCVVFSFWTTTLDVIQTGLQQLDLAFVRFDGNIRAKDKAKVLDAFAGDPAVRIALLTISCGAVGLDLTAASRAYLMEPHWNPSVEEQALARIYRIGQRRPVTTVRYIMRNTLEEHVLKVQKRKNLLVQSLLSEEQEADAVTGLSRLEQLRVLLQD
ncbi:hypothetical protein KC340_g18554 [Hortaea werneckii]|nr:hypothetical protein KC339_g18475 [Hortaea werneckii]KAI7201968.1 hypothetical protein KC365_g18593 [Hortaea werneckii]KAI7283420.1 hypothetical protein KC340_g18554 [Hortaea werneckii]KAI7396713.1 hypothetical protein KC328_g5229 [Hortaea werneckii]